MSVYELLTFGDTQRVNALDIEENHPDVKTSIIQNENAPCDYLKYLQNHCGKRRETTQLAEDYLDSPWDVMLVACRRFCDRGMQNVLP